MDIPKSIKSLLKNQKLCTMASCCDNKSYLSLMNFTYLESENKIILSTRRNSKKYYNITKNKNISLLIFSPSNEISATFLGKASLIEKNHKKEKYYKKLHSEKTNMPQFVLGDNIAVIVFNINEIIISNKEDQVEYINTEIAENLSIIAAMDQNRLIAANNEIPWKLPADLKNFKLKTMGSPVIMGRKTYESIGAPLTGRKNIIMTKNKNYTAKGCQIVHSIEEILEKFSAQKEVFIIGGAEIYRQFLPYSHKLYLTIIEDEFSGDTYFPKINFENWEQISKEKGTTDTKNPYEYNFYIYQRKS